MHIRPLLRSDLPEITAISVSVTHEDPTMSAIFPDAKSPACYAFTLHHYRGKLCNPGFQGFVCVSDRFDGESGPSEARPGTGQGEEVLGFALWVRHGSSEDSPTVRSWTQQQQTLEDKLERSLLQLEGMYTDMLPRYLKRGVAEEKLRALIAASGADTTFARVKSGEGAWELDELVTRFEHRRRGVGKKLLAWGMNVGREEGVPVILSATRMGRSLYEKLGFRVVGFRESGIEGLGCNIHMILDSRGEWVREATEEELWVQCKEDGWMKVDVVWRD